MLFSKRLVVLRCRIFWSCAQQLPCDGLLLVKFAPRIGLWCWSEAQSTSMRYFDCLCAYCLWFRACAQHKPALCRFICCFTMNANEAQAEAWVLVLFLMYWIFLWTQWWVMQSISLHNWGLFLLSTHIWHMLWQWYDVQAPTCFLEWCSKSVLSAAVACLLEIIACF
jgi:hypothetical protein